MSIPSGVTPINDRFAVDRVATIKVGEFRHVALPHGIRAYVCVAIPNAKGLTDGSCDFSRVQTTKGAEPAFQRSDPPVMAPTRTGPGT